MIDIDASTGIDINVDPEDIGFDYETEYEGPWTKRQVLWYELAHIGSMVAEIRRFLRLSDEELEIALSRKWASAPQTVWGDPESPEKYL